VGRIGSGVRVSASFQKKLPSGLCPMAAKRTVTTRGLSGVDLLQIFDVKNYKELVWYLFFTDYKNILK